MTGPARPNEGDDASPDRFASVLEIHEKIRVAVAATDWDALLVLGVENVQYVSGAWLAYAKAYLDRPNIVLWPRAGDPTYIAGAELIDGIRPVTPISKFVGYEERGALPPAVIVETVAEAIRAGGLSDSVIGLELLRTSVPFYDRLRALLPNVRFVAADELLRQLRMVKTPAEIAILRDVALRQDRGIAAALRSAHEGQTELELGRAIQLALLENGCTMTELMVGTGDGARHLGAPSDRTLARGDLVRIDVSSLRRGYFADEGRVAVVGMPSTPQIDAYQRQLDLKASVLEFIAPGRICSEVHAHYLEQGRRLEVSLFEYPYIGVGHGIGVNGDEFPKLNRGDATMIESGMVLNVEPDILGPEREVLHVEDMVLVTDSGVEVLTAADDWSRLPVIPGQH